MQSVIDRRNCVLARLNFLSTDYAEIYNNVISIINPPPGLRKSRIRWIIETHAYIFFSP